MDNIKQIESKKTKSFIKFKKINWIGVILIIIGIAIGLLFNAQWRTKSTRASDPVVSYISLVDTKDELVKKQLFLKNEIKLLNEKIEADQEELKKYSDSKLKVEELEKLQEKAGLTELNGEGIIINLDDSSSVLANTSSIAHAADLRDIINLLWGKGAKAISVNDERIVFGTSIDCIVNTILINTTKTSPPFTIKAIGNAQYLFESLQNNESLKEIYKRVDEEELVFDASKSDNLSIKPYSGSLKLVNANINE